MKTDQAYLFRLNNNVIQVIFEDQSQIIFNTDNDTIQSQVPDGDQIFTYIGTDK